MAETAEQMTESTPASGTVHYEYPLSERMRTHLRVESLYRELRFHLERESQWASRSAVANLLDISAILGRGDMRGDMLKEVERQIGVFDSYRNSPDIDQRRVNTVLNNLRELRQALVVIGPQYLNELRESEFLNAIKHRSAIPGGTCEFDLPAFSHWLRQPYERRRNDIETWMKKLLPLCDSVSELLWLLRSRGKSHEQVAVNGVFHYGLERGTLAGLVRITLPAGSICFPEISGGRHRFSIRFKDWSDPVLPAKQMADNVTFDLTIC